MKVMVANGEKLYCNGCCNGVRIFFHGIMFTIEFFFLAIEGCDAVLSTQWLGTLGPIWSDFTKLVMSFEYKGSRMELEGINGPTHKVVEGGVAVRE